MARISVRSQSYGPPPRSGRLLAYPDKGRGLPAQVFHDGTLALRLLFWTDMIIERARDDSPTGEDLPSKASAQPIARFDMATPAWFSRRYLMSVTTDIASVMGSMFGRACPWASARHCPVWHRCGDVCSGTNERTSNLSVVVYSGLTTTAEDKVRLEFTLNLCYTVHYEWTIDTKTKVPNPVGAAGLSCRFGLDGAACDLTAICIGLYQTGLARADRERRLPPPILRKRNVGSQDGLEDSFIIRAMDHGT